MTDSPARREGRPPDSASASDDADAQVPELQPRLAISAHQATAVPKLARARMLSQTNDIYAQPETRHLAERALYNRKAREVLGLDGGPPGRPTHRGGGVDVDRILREKPELREPTRQLFRDTYDLWPGTTIEFINAFSDDLVEAVLSDFTGIDPEDLSKWLDTVLMVGAAVEGAPGSRPQPMQLPTREHFLGVSELSDQDLAALERELGRVGTAEALMVLAVVTAQDQGIIEEPVGIVAGTTHIYCAKEALGLGRVAVRAGAADVAVGHGPENAPIHHAVRSAAHFVVPTPRGESRLIRAVTLPLVAPADLRALKEGSASERAYTRSWLMGCGLSPLVARGQVSCTAQQAHAARRLEDEWVERTGHAPPILIPAIRIERARPHPVFSSPVVPYSREMPGNRLEELRQMPQILGPKARIWLAEAGVEDATAEGDAIEPGWKIRLPSGRLVAGRYPIAEPDLFHRSWATVFRVEDQLELSELEYPVALGHFRSDDLVLLQAVGERDPESDTRPAMWLVASRSLRSNPELAAEVGELLRRVHGSRLDSSALREARTASFALPASLLGGRAKKPHTWQTRELERELAFLAPLMADAAAEENDAR